FAQDQQRRFQRAHETFCRTAGTRLSAELRVPIELEVLSIDQHTFGAAIAGIPQPSVLGIVDVGPIGTTIIATAELSAVSRMIDRLLGGEGKQGRQRDLSEVEITLAR